MKSLCRALLCVTLCGLAGASFGQDVRLPERTRVVLDNGVTLVLAEKHEVPLIGVEAVLEGGAITDPGSQAGLSALLAGLLEKGAGTRDAAAFAEAVAAVGGTLSAGADLEAITVSGEFMSRDADLMVELLADMLQRPALAEDEFDKLKNRAAEFIRAAKDSNLGALVPLYGRALLFGQHAYGRPVSGSEASLAAIRHADVQRHYEAQLGADRLVIAVAGDFDTAAMQAKLTDAFAGWRAAAQPLHEVPPPAPLTGRRVLLVDKPGATQTYFWLGNVGVAVTYPQRAELDIANTVFGGRFTSILNNALRIESGLTYGAFSSLSRHAAPGSLAIYSFTETASTMAAVDMALDLLGAFRTSGIDAAQVTSAKNYILGQFAPRLETAAQLAGAFAELEQYGLGTDYIDGYGPAVAAAEAASINAVIAEVYPVPADLAIVLLGDAEKMRDAAAGYGPVVEMPITEPRFKAPAAEPAVAGQRSK
ncbi:MAG: pitrilysin family protein [Woeseiaceae bacterium]|nr:pitrilysin family protein [Woeseiaceae bacterium]